MTSRGARKRLVGMGHSGWTRWPRCPALGVGRAYHPVKEPEWLQLDLNILPINDFDNKCLVRGSIHQKNGPVISRIINPVFPDAHFGHPAEGADAKDRGISEYGLIAGAGMGTAVVLIHFSRDAAVISLSFSNKSNAAWLGGEE